MKAIQLLISKVNGLRGSFYYLAGNLSQAFVVLLVSPLLARVLSAREFGEIGLIGSITALFTPLIHLSFFNYFSLKYAQLRDAQITAEDFSQIKSTIFCSIFFFNIFFQFLVFGIFSSQFALAFNEYTLYPSIIFSTIYTFLSSYLTFDLLVLRIQRDARSYFLRSVVVNLSIQLLVVFFVVLLEMGTFGRYLAPMIVIFIYFIFFFANHFRDFTLSNFKYGEFVHIFRFSVPLLLGSVLVFFNKEFDKIVLSNFVSPEELGIYSLGQTQANYYFTVTTSFFMFFESELFLNRTDFRVQMKIIYRAVSVNLIFILPFIFLSKYIASFLTAGNFVESHYFAQLLVCSIFFSSIYKLLITIFSVYNVTRYVLFINLIYFLVSVLLLSLFSYFFSSQGAAISKIISNFILVFICVLFLKNVRNSQRL